MSRIVVIGQGYVGLPMALRAAEVGHDVIGLESNQCLVESLNNGKSHIDDVGNDRLQRGLASTYHATADPGCISSSQVVVVCVPTPLTQSGDPDLAPLESAAAVIGERLSSGTLVILESTTYPGTTSEIFAPLVLVQGWRLGIDVNIAFSPERIDPGNRVYDVKNTPKVVGGLTPGCTQAAREFYATFIDEVIPAKGAIEAEMAKLLENTFRHVNIGLVNEMVRFCDELNIDLWDAINCAASKPFGFMAFRPGPGVGGHCIPVDPSYLSHRVRAKLGYAFRMVELAEEINKAAPFYVADRVWRLLNERGLAVSQARVLLVGVSYKPDVSDYRESPAGPLADRLRSWGATISFHDPLVLQWKVQEPDGVVLLNSVSDLYEAAAENDIVVLLQTHSVYDLRRLGATSPLLLDTRGAMPESAAVRRL